MAPKKNIQFIPSRIINIKHVTHQQMAIKQCCQHTIHAFIQVVKCKGECPYIL